MLIYTIFTVVNKVSLGSQARPTHELLFIGGQIKPNIYFFSFFILNTTIEHLRGLRPIGWEPLVQCIYLCCCEQGGIDSDTEREAVCSFS